MLFNSIQFAVFFVVVMALYRALSHRWQNRMLLVASYVFYGAWDYRFLALIFISTVTSYWCGRHVHDEPDPRRRKLYIGISVLINLGILGFFKYFGFFTESLAVLLESVGLQGYRVGLDVVLPVGISFYTFQTMSYAIDIYRGEMEPCRGFLDFALFVSFFPQLVAGPIERAKNLVPQVVNPRRVTLEDFTEGFFLAFWGYLKKLLIADTMARIANPIFSQTAGFSSSEVAIGALAFAFQIYGDFSGYSDIARGTARMMGFRLMRNFDLPYFAKSPQEFWRRWHISLSTWLRDYLYIPLGGSRKGKLRTAVNIMLTMLLGGLWHGAAWTFVIWGGFHGVLLVVQRAVRDRIGAWKPPRPLSAVTPVLAMAGMFVLTLYGWLIFRCQSFGQLWNMTAALVRLDFDLSVVKGVAKVGVYCTPLLLQQTARYFFGGWESIARRPVAFQVAFYVICFYAILIFGAFDGQGFIYFQF